MQRRTMISMAGGLCAGVALPGRGQIPQRVYRVGNLSPGRSADSQPSPVARAAQRELGWEEGRNFTNESRFAEGQAGRLPALAAELVALRVDVIVAVGNAAIAAAKAATSTIPIVMLYANNPEESGFVASLARPGGNITGMSIGGLGIVGKKLQILQALAPKARQVHWLATVVDQGSQVDYEASKDAAAAIGLRSALLVVRSADDLDRALARLDQERVEAIYVTSLDPSISQVPAQRARIIAYAASHAVPAMYPVRHWVVEGALMSYGANFDDVPRRVVAFVDRILKGANPASMAVEQPTRFDFAVNLKTARAMGLTIPRGVMLQATELIE